MTSDISWRAKSKQCHHVFAEFARRVAFWRVLANGEFSRKAASNLTRALPDHPGELVALGSTLLSVEVVKPRLTLVPSSRNLVSLGNRVERVCIREH